MKIFKVVVLKIKRVFVHMFLLFFFRIIAFMNLKGEVKFFGREKKRKVFAQRQQFNLLW